MAIITISVVIMGDPGVEMLINLPKLSLLASEEAGTQTQTNCLKLETESITIILKCHVGSNKI